MNASRSIAALILAAGSSSRMGAGRHKLLLPLAGRPVLAHVIEAALASQARPLIVILGHQAEQVRNQIATYTHNPAVTLVENLAYLQGMSTSMRTGLQALMAGDQSAETAQVGGALILLGDQPLLNPHVLDLLITTRETTGKQIIAPLYEGKRGNPVLFAANLFPELLEVTGDEGGRSVIERHRAEFTTVEVGNSMANYDVDTWEAYQQVLEAWDHRPDA